MERDAILAAEGRFWSRVDRRGEDECWPWLGYTVKGGRGILSVSNKTMTAPRFSFHLHYGAIPEGQFACHACDNPSCVNPAHLWLGTASDNMADMLAKGRGFHNSLSRCKHGHEFSAENTAYNKRGGRVCKACRSIGVVRAKRKKREATGTPIRAYVKNVRESRWQLAANKVK